MKSAATIVGITVVAGAIVVAPFAIYPVLLMKVLCFALFASAFNLLVGYTGLMSFGHAAFFGTGAYVAGYFIKVWGVTPEIALLFAAMMAGLIGLLIGALAIRRHGIYFSMVTLALSQMVFFFFLQSKFTGGEDGLQGVPRGYLFGLISLKSDVALYYFICAVFVLAILLIWRIVNSPFGRVLNSIRENEQRALSLGYEVSQFKLLTFVISAALAGLAGAAKTLIFGFATLVDAQWHMSGEVILMTLLGGIGTLSGPIVGSTIVVLLQNLLADKVGSKVTVIMGSIFMICVVVFRKGIVGELTETLNRLRLKRALVDQMKPGVAKADAAATELS
jgi:branched-chain amino acid transport system permease protein